MQTHTPPADAVHETYSDMLSRTIACALRLYDKAEDVDIYIYHSQYKDLCDRMAANWIACKCDTISGYGRALAYSIVGKQYEINRFDEMGELHYGSIVHKNGNVVYLQQYWDAIAKYVTKSLSDLI